jgi:hypothetical protein
VRMTHSGRRLRLYGRLYQAAGYLLRRRGARAPGRKPRGVPAALTGRWADASDCRELALGPDGSVVVRLYDQVRKGSCEVDGSARVVKINVDGIETSYCYEISANALTLTQSLSGSTSTYYKIR